MVKDFVAVFAHPRLTSDAYGTAISRYFDSGIPVPIVIFADPTGREIPGTRLSPSKAPIRSEYLKNAKKALDAFRAGAKPDELKKVWKRIGAAVSAREEGEAAGAAIATLQKIRSEFPEKNPIRGGIDEYLERVEKEEAAGYLELAESDLGPDGDLETGIATLFAMQRDFPGLPSSIKATAKLESIAKDASKAEPYKAAKREHDAWVALHAADAMARAGKVKEATAAWKKVVTDFEDSEAAAEAEDRDPDDYKPER